MSDMTDRLDVLGLSAVEHRGPATAQTVPGRAGSSSSVTPCRSNPSSNASTLCAFGSGLRPGRARILGVSRRQELTTPGPGCGAFSPKI